MIIAWTARVQGHRSRALNVRYVMEVDAKSNQAFAWLMENVTAMEIWNLGNLVK
jgi:hypothetical protein